MSANTFQFSNKRPRHERVKVRSYGADVMKSEPDDPKPVQGIMPDSKEEYFTALALDRMNLQYEFQFEVNGGRNRKGGQIVDFLVYTTPLPTPLYVQGSYWHRGAQKMQDIVNQENLKRIFRGQLLDPVNIDSELLTTKEMAYTTIKRLFGA